MISPRLILVSCLAVSCACGAGTPDPAPANATPAATAVEPVAIPETKGHPAATDGDMRVLEPFTGDLDALIERGAIRILVTPSRTHFNAGQGVYAGRLVDAAVFFEHFVNRQIAPATIRVILIPAAETSMVRDLVSGQGDIAANLRRTFERDEQVAFAVPWRTGVRELIVTGPGVPPLVSLEDAGGRAIHVSRQSDHYASIARLNEQLKKIARPPAKIVDAGVSQTDEDLLELVNAGKAPATLVDDYIYERWRATFDKTAANRDVAVSQDGEIAWAVRKDAPKLLALVNEFFTAHRLGF